jgi:dihydroorotate dehydrogenase
MNGYDLAKPLLFSLPAETAHRLCHGTVGLAGHWPVDRTLARHYAVDDPRLCVDALGETFPNPVGVAAGFDKNAEAVRGLAALGFGFVEVGGVTAVPQSGNQRPRMFRLPEDDAVINRMGLNNDGAETIGRRLQNLDAPVPVGVNIAKSEHVDTAGAPADYLATYEEVAAGGDLFGGNVSCPNSQGFEELQNREARKAIITKRKR